MTGYNFKKEAKLYVVHAGNQYEICISDVSFSQTFTSESVPVKTLHDQSLMFDEAVINKANRANFSLELPLIKESDYQILFDLALDYDNTSSIYRKLLKTFDVYVATEQDVFKIEYGVFTTTTFEIERDEVIKLSLEGEASKVSKVGTKDSYVIPGIPQPVTANPTYLIARKLYVSIDSVDIPKSIYKFSAELQNNISWIGYQTVNEALTAVDASTSMFPTQFTLEKRIFAGSLGLYIDGENDNNLQEWATNVPIHIEAGLDEGGTVYGFQFNMSSCTYTNRLMVGSTFTQHYDWRMTESPANLGDVINYITT